MTLAMPAILPWARLVATMYMMAGPGVSRIASATVENSARVLRSGMRWRVYATRIGGETRGPADGCDSNAGSAAGSNGQA